MQRIVVILKSLVLILVVVTAWSLATAAFVAGVEVFSPGNRRVESAGTVVTLAAAAFFLRRGWRRIWAETPRRGRRQGRGSRRKRGLDDLYEEGFGGGRRVLGDDLPHARRWMGKETLRVGNVTLARPLAYASQGQVEACPGTICRGAKVASEGEVFDEELEPWPSYSRLSPQGRRGYLLWLAGGAAGRAVSPSYVVLYLTGLEQRVVGEHADLARIRAEALRLHGRFRHRRSIARYTGALVGMTHTLDGDGDPGPSFDRLTADHPGKPPLSFLRMISTCWPSDRWPARYVVELLRHHASNTVVHKRAWAQFAELFGQRFAAAYPEGFAPRRNAKRRHERYRWIARTGTEPVEYPFIEPTALGTQWTRLERLWGEVTAELRPYALAAGRDSLSAGELYERLPDELRTGDHPEQRAWQQWFEAGADEEEHLLTTWGVLVALSPSITRREDTDQVSPAESRQAAALCDSVGLAMEPDPRLGRGRSRPLDEMVLVYRPAGEPTAPSPRHEALGLVVELCVGVAAADGEISDEEIDVILAQVDRQDELDDAERERLQAGVTYFRRTGAGLRRATKRRLGKLPAAARQALAHLVVLVALADGAVAAAEEAALRRVYRALGLPPDELDEILRPHRPATDGEGADDESEEDTGDAPRLTIDWNRVADVTADTRDVQALLQAALTAEGEPGVGTVDPVPPPAPPSPGDFGDHGATPLDPRAAPLLAWIRSQPTATIPAPEWDARCAEHGLMAEMAVDLINEWADEELGDYLVEADGDDAYTLHRDLL